MSGAIYFFAYSYKLLINKLQIMDINKMINLNIKKYVLIATLGMSMMLTGCTGEMINNIQYSQTDFSVKPDYVWDGSKSYFMNKIHEVCST